MCFVLYASHCTCARCSAIASKEIVDSLASKHAAIEPAPHPSLQRKAMSNGKCNELLRLRHRAQDAVGDTYVDVTPQELYDLVHRCEIAEYRQHVATELAAKLQRELEWSKAEIARLDGVVAAARAFSRSHMPPQGPCQICGAPCAQPADPHAVRVCAGCSDKHFGAQVH